MKNMNKVVHVPAHKAPLFKTVVRQVSTGETKTGIFGKEIKITKGVSEKVLDGYSDSKIDGQRLSEDISETSYRDMAPYTNAKIALKAASKKAMMARYKSDEQRDLFESF